MVLCSVVHRRKFTPLHWACESLDPKRVYAILRTDDSPRLLRARNKAKHTALQLVTKREASYPKGTLLSKPLATLLRKAKRPWDVESRHVWPRSFRRGVRLLLCVARRRADDAPSGRWIPLEVLESILSFCGRDWFAAVCGGGDSSVGEAVPSSLLACAWCHRAPAKAVNSGPGSLKRCKCRLVSFCGKECANKLWKTHKGRCLEEKARLKREEAEE